MGTADSGRVRRPKIGLLAVQGAAVLVASAFLSIGILGFVPGVTARLDTMHWAGHHSTAQLFGMFDVSVLHNLVHLAFGVAGLVLSRTYARARAYLIVGGLLFLALWIYGLLIAPGGASNMSNIVPVNNADNWLHFAIGVVMILLGLTLAGSRVPTGAGGEVLLPPDETG
jgi:hypothetical protein